ncbi:hypothetical protein OG689_44140 [Kitasatospora sp. NBC_00240]|uniref:hypothetical protein n=1 Tax=Kitasatospora sp. NBC_00240 TaxID=2903567 RepID=UPI00225958A1|nr:hypothetical protein [Kitasatospora sp. NBC_00240]MCX5216128.1 hypothetical protein [Kitasatospora sp. NBC_00240]
MPQWGSAETSNGVDYAVNLTLGAFVALPAIGVILIWGLEPTAAAAGLVLALAGIADRSYLAIRRARAS